MKKIIYRTAAINDITKITKLEKKVWGKQGATPEMILSRISTFRDGVIVAEEELGIVGAVFFQIIDYKSTIDFKTWDNYTDNGLIQATHCSEGDTIFGVGLSVLPNHRFKKIGSQLIAESINVAVKYNIRRGILGARIPNYCLFPNIPVENYVKLRNENGQLVDPELRLYERFGLQIKKILPEYFPDAQSRNYGVILEWENPFL